jgi:hypothetical protein
MKIFTNIFKRNNDTSIVKAKRIKFSNEDEYDGIIQFLYIIYYFKNRRYGKWF